MLKGNQLTEKITGLKLPETIVGCVFFIKKMQRPPTLSFLSCIRQAFPTLNQYFLISRQLKPF